MTIPAPTGEASENVGNKSGQGGNQTDANGLGRSDRNEPTVTDTVNTDRGLQAPQKDKLEPPAQPVSQIEEEVHRRRLAVAGEYHGPEGVMTPETPVRFSAELEYRLWRKIDELDSCLGEDIEVAIRRGERISGLSEMIHELNASWRQRANSPEWKALGQVLDRISFVEGRLAEIDKEIAGNNQNKSQLKAEKKRLEEEMEKVLEKRKQEALKAIEQGPNKNIFGGLTEEMIAYGFITQQEEAVFEQVGLALSTGGERPSINFDLSPSNIERILSEDIPPGDRRFLTYIKDKLHIKDFDWRNLLLYGGGGTLGGLSGLSVGVLAKLVGASTLGALGADAGGAGVGVAGGLGAALLIKAVVRDYRNWQLEVHQGQQGEKLSFTITWKKREKALPEEMKGNPIARHFAGNVENAVRFLKETEEIRHEIAQRLRVPEWTIDVGDPNVNIWEGRGQGLLIQQKFHDYLHLILENEFKGEGGEAKKFSDLSPSEQRDVFSRAWDLAAYEYAEERLSKLAKQVAERRAKRGLEPARDSELITRAERLEKGEVVTERGGSSREELEKSKKEQESRRARQEQVKSEILELQKKITDLEKDIQEAQVELDAVKEEKGKRGQNGQEGTGEIGDLESRKKRAEKELESLQSQLGEYKDGQLSGLLQAVVQSDVALTLAQQKMNQAKSVLDARQRELDRLKTALVQPSEKRISDTKHKEMEERIRVLEGGGEGSISEAQNNYSNASEEHAICKRQNEELQSQLTRLRERINTYLGSAETQGSLAWYENQILSAEKAVRDKQAALKKKEIQLQFSKIKTKTLLEELGLDKNAIPSETMIDGLIRQTQEEIDKLQKQIEELPEGEGKPAASQADKEKAKALRIASRAVSETALSTLSTGILDGTVKLDEFTETTDDRGYRRFIEKLLESQALVAGDKGEWDTVLKLVPKEAIARAIAQIWNIEEKDFSELAHYLGYDKIRAMAVFRLVADEMYERCRRYQPFYKKT